MPDREPLSGMDNAWRRMGTPSNLMSVTGLLTFEERVGYEEMCDRLAERLLRFDRFGQRIGGQKRRLLRPYWEFVDGFDVHNHVYDLSLPEPADEDCLERFVGTLMSRPLDERRPLWELYLVDNVGPGDGNAAVLRINHSLGDGFALLYVMLGLADNPSELEFPVDGLSAPPVPGAAERDGNGRDSPEPTTTTDPMDGRSPSGVLDTLGTALRAVKAGYNLLTMPDEPQTSLFGTLGQTKRVAWTRRLDLDRVKQVGQAHDATVNDVLLATTAGAFRRVLDDRGEDTDGLELRCTVPVNLRPMAQRTESLGNFFGLLFLPVPVGTSDLEERLETVAERTDARKAGVEAYLMYKLLAVAGRLPEPVQNLAMRLFEKQATGIVTNVPGPTGPAKFAGTEIEDMIFWVPQANDQGLGISIISYNGGIRVGVAADANLLPEPREMTEAFETELDTLCGENG